MVIRPDTHPEAFVPVPPDGGWGWIVVAAAFLTNLIIDGICVSFGIMVTDLVEHFNTSVASVMLLGSLLVGMYQIAGEYIVLIYDRIAIFVNFRNIFIGFLCLIIFDECQ
ncbi:unnamed protein product [Hymenolepis diminuta]|uniref:MFS domain-containing protein n=1 Tax=Hymenolepis diminuta TaxID=6216 RepID=A0A0R3SMJ8_HYMDI|nr:unnamed protein product [Hymenolepis diminuta]